MGFELIDRESRSLPPVQTRGIDAETTQKDPSKSTSSEEGECVTPKSEQHAVKRPLVCPSAPRKPRPVKRKLQPPADGFYPVPSDLASIFIPLPCPVIKKIRVGS